MKNLISKFNKKIFLFFLFFLFFLNYGLIFSENIKNINIDEIYKLIEQKNNELNNLLKQKQILEKELEAISSDKNNYQKEIIRLNNNIKQLNLAIETNKLAIDKLELEIDLIKDNIYQSEKMIELKNQTINKIFFELQQYDKENILILLLKNKSIAQNFNEVKNLIILNQNLKKELDDLTEAKKKLIINLEDLNNKKSKKEIEINNYYNRQLILNEYKKVNQEFLNQTKNQEKIYQQKIDELEKKQAEIGKIINELEERLRKEYNQALIPTKNKGVLKLPLDEIYITQNYGYTEFAKRAYKTKFHNGIDFRASIGTPIYAATDGKIIKIDNNDLGFSFYNRYQYGLYILINHYNGLSTLYAHLSKVLVQEGQKVTRGQLIGYSGNTGYSYGPHLHFGVYLTDSLEFKKIPPANGLVPIGVTVDPKDYLEPF